MKIKDCIYWLFKNSRQFHRMIMVCTLIGILHAAISLYFVYVCKHLIDIATNVSDDSLSLYIGWMILCIVAQIILAAFRGKLTIRNEIGLRNYLHATLFTRLMTGEPVELGKFHSGDILNRLESDVASVTETLCITIPSVIITFTQLSGALVFLTLLDAHLTAILIFVMPLALLLSKKYILRMRQMSREIRKTDSSIQSHIQENFQHRVLVQTLEYTSHSVKKLTSLLNGLNEKVNQRANFSIFSRSMVQTGFSSGYAIAFLWGVYGLYKHTITFGMMTAFLQLVAQIQRPMLDLSKQIPTFIKAITAIERLAELTELPQEEQGQPLHLSEKSGIRIRQMSFTYPNHPRQIFSGFSHDFQPGSLTAVVGETGTGKSTLFKLILALLKPQEGEIIFYNGHQQINASPLTRCNLSYVPQGNTLLSGTIRENLKMGNPSATEEEMLKALHTAVADFVLDFPDGIDTYCGEKGYGLSEGQAQRIAIARGLLRPGGILLLDEPSSSLDQDTEQLLLQRLSTQLQNKTLILITHRDAIAQLCQYTLHLKTNEE